MIVAAALALLVAAPVAQSGVFRVYACKTPAGQVAPLDGWSNANAMAYSGPYNDCAAGVGFGVYMGTEPAAPNHAWTGVQSGFWQLSLPSGLTLDRLDARRTLALGPPAGGHTDTGNGHPFGWVAMGGATPEHCAAYLSCSSLGVPGFGDHSANDRSYEIPGATTFRIEAGCGGADPNAWCAPAAVNQRRVDLRFWRATLHVRDDSSPQLTQPVIGTVRGAGPRKGVETLAFSAADTGSGVYKVVVTLGGKQLVNATPSTNGGRCVDAGSSPSDAYEFVHLQPCAAAANVSLSVDTREVSDGERLLEVQVIDAAGNATPVLSERIEVRNAAPTSTTPGTNSSPGTATPPGATSSPGGTSTPSGDPALPPGGATLFAGAANLVLDKRNAKVVRAPYGAKRTLGGRVVVAGTKTPVVGVTVAVRERLRHVGAGWREVAPVLTDAGGRFRVPVGTDASRLVRLSVGSTTATVRVDAQARLALRAATRRVRPGARLKLTGKVTVAALPGRGAVVALQSRWDGRWRTVDTVRTSRGGAFSWRYTLRRSRRGTLPFRAVLLPTTDVAASGGRSRPVNVRVG